MLFTTKRNLELSGVMRPLDKANVIMDKCLQSDYTNKKPLKTNALALAVGIPTILRISQRKSIWEKKKKSD